MQDFALFLFGNLSIATIRTLEGEHRVTGGPILMSAWTAHQLGCSVGVLTKSSLSDKSLLQEFPLAEEDIFWCESPETTSNKLVFCSPSMETRRLINTKRADPYKIREFPSISAKVVQHCSPVAGEIDLDVIRFIASQFPIALDAQALMRKVSPNGETKYTDWEDKWTAMPLISYFKADATEASILTGFNTETHEGRVSAGKKMVEWGAKEVVITHHTELIAITKSQVVFSPFKNRSLIGRTGRGDTSFTTYIAQRFIKRPADAVKFAAALTSLKMEIPGPFKKSRQDVDAFVRDFY
jgi:sugar/nucleoside kinase (ribokinase family)